jgi:hypothetical protein
MENQEIKVELKCSDCKEVLTVATPEWTTDDGLPLCESCRDNYSVCYACENLILTENGVMIDGDFYCDDCKNENHFYCNGCDTWQHVDGCCTDNNEDLYCEHCRDRGRGDFESDDNGSLDEKGVTMTKKYQSKDYGKIIKSARGFAVEVECYSKDDYNAVNEFVEESLPEEIGVSTDGSLNNNGVEFQTPILKGAKGETLLKDFCNSLVREGFYVDKTCGLHVHIDGAKDFTNQKLKNTSGDMRLKNFKNLFATYYILDDVISNFLPMSRRQNNYCKRLSNDYNLKEVMSVYSQSDFEKIWYRCDDLNRIDEMKKRKCNETRYHGVNMHCLLWQNHLEVRYHSGTIDKNKILFWVELNLAIVNYAVKNFNLADLQKIQALTNTATKRSETYKLLGFDNDSAIVGYFEARAKKFCNNELSAEVTENK